ncbi:CpaF family protein [Candidatus Poribacteria bacterium]|nr:CpaF family protein [Candidatus Poribacteria bacterium]
MSLIERLRKFEMTNPPRKEETGETQRAKPGRVERTRSRTFSSSVASYRPSRSSEVYEREPLTHRVVQQTLNAQPLNAELTTESDLDLELKIRIHSQVLDLLPPELLSSDDEARIKIEVERILSSILNREMISLSRGEKEKLFDEIMAEILGLGPIEEFMKDPEVTEIMVNGPHRIYIERGGRIYPTGKKFKDDEHLLRIIHRIIAPLNRRLDETNPMVDARLPDGSRVNAVIPPISLIGPVLTIHKFYKERFTMDELIQLGTIDRRMADFLAACVVARLDVMISGGTSTGKTTFLNVLSSFIPEGERLITIEDAAELKLHQEHVITLEARPAGLTGRGGVSIRDLVRNALRMRPDRIIIGEVRGGEALDLLQAMNTGHEGSMSTCHANSPLDMISRLETMALMSGIELPERAIREQIASALDVIVQMGRFPDGSRKVVKITEVQGIQADKVILQDIFVFRRKGLDRNGRVIGEFTYTGARPSFLDQLQEFGFDPAKLGIL